MLKCVLTNYQSWKINFLRPHCWNIFAPKSFTKRHLCQWIFLFRQMTTMLADRVLLHLKQVLHSRSLLLTFNGIIDIDFSIHSEHLSPNKPIIVYWTLILLSILQSITYAVRHASAAAFDGYHHVWVGNWKRARWWSFRGLLIHELQNDGNLISICAFNWYLTQFIGFIIYQIDQFIIHGKEFWEISRQFQSTSSSSSPRAHILAADWNSITLNFSIFTSFVILFIVLCDTFCTDVVKNL